MIMSLISTLFSGLFGLTVEVGGALEALGGGIGAMLSIFG